MSYGQISIIKRTGADAGIFCPITEKGVTIGRDLKCDIRVQMAKVSRLHCQIVVETVGKDSLVVLKNMSKNTMIVNNSKLGRSQVMGLEDGDVFQIIDRKFRYDSAAQKENYHNNDNMVIQDHQSSVTVEYDPSSRQRKISIGVSDDYTPMKPNLGKRRRSNSIGQQPHTEKIPRTFANQEARKASLPPSPLRKETKVDEDIWQASPYNKPLESESIHYREDDASPTPLDSIPESPFGAFREFDHNLSSISFIDPDSSIECGEPKDPAIAIKEGDRVFQVGQIMKKQIGNPQKFNPSTPKPASKNTQRPSSILKRPQSARRAAPRKVSFAAADKVLLTPMTNSQLNAVIYHTPCKTRSPLNKTVELPLLDKTPAEFLDDSEEERISTFGNQSPFLDSDSEDSDSENDIDDSIEDANISSISFGVPGVSPSMMATIQSTIDDIDDLSDDEENITALVSTIQPPIEKSPKITKEDDIMMDEEEDNMDESSPIQSTTTRTRKRTNSFPHQSTNNVTLSKRHYSLAALNDDSEDSSVNITPTFASSPVEKPKSSLKTLNISPLDIKQTEEKGMEETVTPIQSKKSTSFQCKSASRISKVIPFPNDGNKKRRAQSDAPIDGAMPVPISLPSPKQKKFLKSVDEHVSTPIPMKSIQIEENDTFEMTPPTESLPVAIEDTTPNTPMELFSTKKGSASTGKRRRKSRRSSTGFPSSTPSSPAAKKQRTKESEEPIAPLSNAVVEIIDHNNSNILPDTSSMSPIGGIPVNMSTPKESESNPGFLSSTPIRFVQSVANVLSTPIRKFGSMFNAEEEESLFGIWKQLRNYIRELNDDSISNYFYNDSEEYVSMTQMYDNIQTGVYESKSDFRKDFFNTLNRTIENNDSEQLDSFTAYAINLFGEQEKESSIEEDEMIEKEENNIIEDTTDAVEAEEPTADVSESIDIEMKDDDDSISLQEETPSAILNPILAESRKLSIPMEESEDFFSARSELDQSIELADTSKDSLPNSPIVVKSIPNSPKTPKSIKTIEEELIDEEIEVENEVEEEEVVEDEEMKDAESTAIEFTEDETEKSIKDSEVIVEEESCIDEDDTIVDNIDIVEAEEPSDISIVSECDSKVDEDKLMNEDVSLEESLEEENIVEEEIIASPEVNASESMVSEELVISEENDEPSNEEHSKESKKSLDNSSSLDESEIIIEDESELVLEDSESVQIDTSKDKVEESIVNEEESESSEEEVEEEPKVDYNSWTCVVLRKELKKRNLDTKGLKRVLVARLEEDDAKSVPEEEESKSESEEIVLADESSEEVVIEEESVEDEIVIAEVSELSESEEVEEEEPKVDYNSWTCVVLRKELKKRNLDTKGLKKVLVARLEEDDKGGKVEETTPEPKKTKTTKKVAPKKNPAPKKSQPARRSTRRR